MKARRDRHTRVFAKASILRHLSIFSFPSVYLRRFGFKKNQNQTQTPAHRLFKSYSIAVAVVFAIGSITPSNVFSYNSPYASNLEGLDNLNMAATSSTLMTDQEGYLTKINPQTEFSDRSSTNDHLVHTVATGETISTIAQQYGLKTNTVLWENGLIANAKIKTGQQLLIPPVDGISHIVSKGEDVGKIASTYNINKDAIIKQNSLDANAQLRTGQFLFIPGAKPLPNNISIPGTRDTAAKVESSSRIKNIGSTLKIDASTIGANSDSKSSGTKMFIKPTRGVITQYFKSGHPAYDIANTDKPPIWAAAEGTVVKASSGTWGGGYGSHVIIDHGNGVQTLYGHMEYLSVSVGDKVTQGQVIGKMGRTGNVRGRTGIHLHFEVRVNGVKKNPGGYTDF